jgi:hypothetical protein
MVVTILLVVGLYDEEAIWYLPSASETLRKKRLRNYTMTQWKGEKETAQMYNSKPG